MEFKMKLFVVFSFFFFSSCTFFHHLRFYNTLTRNPVVLEGRYSKGKLLLVPIGGNKIAYYNKKGYF